LAAGSPFSPSFSIFLSALAGSLLAGLPRFFVSLDSFSFIYNLQHISKQFSSTNIHYVSLNKTYVIWFWGSTTIPLFCNNSIVRHYAYFLMGSM